MLAEYGSDFFADLIIGNGTPNTTWYLALLIDVPYATIDGTDLVDFEIADASYERKQLLNTDFSESSGGVVSTNVGVAWDAAVEDWGQVNGYALVDDLTDGNVYILGEFPSPLFVSAGQRLSIPAGIISISISTTDAGDED